jgi:adenine C2-methylase RlmN of 23S rRNA A2503 and tRNA A37
MLQDFLTYITVIAASAYAVYSFWQILFSSSAQSGCGSGCSSCSTDKANIMKAVKLKKKELYYKPQ